MERTDPQGTVPIKLVTTPIHVMSDSGDAAFARQVMAGCLAAAAQGNMDGYFDLGVAFSTGSHGFTSDLIEAHKWFNLAAVGGHAEAAQVRAEVAEDMTAREIAEAQRRAREWLRALPAGQIRAA